MLQERSRDVWQQLQGNKPHLPHFLTEVRLLGDVQRKIERAGGPDVPVVYLPGRFAPEVWIWSRLSEDGAGYAGSLGVHGSDLESMTRQLDSVYDSASDTPAQIAKTKLRGLAEATGRTSPDICRVVSRLESDRPESEIQPLVEQLDEALESWRAARWRPT